MYWFELHIHYLFKIKLAKKINIALKNLSDI